MPELAQKGNFRLHVKAALASGRLDDVCFKREISRRFTSLNTHLVLQRRDITFSSVFSHGLVLC